MANVFFSCHLLNCTAAQKMESNRQSPASPSFTHPNLTLDPLTHRNTSLSVKASHPPHDHRLARFSLTPHLAFARPSRCSRGFPSAPGHRSGGRLENQIEYRCSTISSRPLTFQQSALDPSHEPAPDLLFFCDSAKLTMEPIFFRTTACTWRLLRALRLMIA